MILFVPVPSLLLSWFEGRGFEAPLVWVYVYSLFYLKTSFSSFSGGWVCGE